ncbi:MAG: hypothetical protein HQ486_03620 [Acidimicrobiaceae bacterium]|nr:hypothetical protein [Acidimicrobiaceae bacterium]
MNFTKVVFGMLVLVGCGSSPTLSFLNTASTVQESIHGDSLTATTVAASTITVASETGLVASAADSVASAADLVDQVREQFAESLQWINQCNQRPKACHVEDFTIVGTDYHQALSDQMNLYASSNIYSRPGHGQRLVRIESVNVDRSTMIAEIETCIYDTVILYMDGFIFNDRISSSRARWTLQLDNQRWRWIYYEIHKKLYNTDICNFKP